MMQLVWNRSNVDCMMKTGIVGGSTSSGAVPRRHRHSCPGAEAAAHAVGTERLLISTTRRICRSNGLS
eukprot:2126924-Prymnesium_polylepis.1